MTSNPTRTSPVKRGQFILQNILGTPAPPPPPNIPPLELSKAAFGGHDPSLREMLAEHRKNPLCSSCHGRMDPLGLALETFNALGEWRTTDAGQPIATSGKLISGETFRDVRELKHVITRERRADFYRCLAEKMLTYGLGRSLGYGDTEAVDRIVDDLERSGGRFSALLLGVIDSAPSRRKGGRPTPEPPDPRLPLPPLLQMKTIQSPTTDRTDTPGVSRRLFFKGMGMCLGLPLMESLLPARLRAATAVPAPGTTPSGSPLRMAFIYFPNGANQKLWWPAAKGPASSSARRWSRWPRSRTRSRSSAASTTSTPPAARTDPATTPGPAASS